MSVVNAPQHTMRRAKLLRPLLGADLVERPRLRQRLLDGLTRPLTLLSTPAGYGKTTLLCQWLAACPYRSAWLSLDERDADLPTFLALIVAALRTLQPDVGRETLGLLHLPALPTPDALAATLGDELLDLPDPVVLALDDYDAIADPRVHAFLSALLAFPPPNLHLALAVRVEPPLPLARLRGRDQVTELRGTDLRFSAEEASAFLARVGGGAFDPAVVALLEERTEGWATGLRLAALSLHNDGDSAAVARAFAGRRQRQAMEYLLDEVLARQPAAAQAFLLRTAIAERLCAPLCAALMEPLATLGEVEATLDHLLRANLFTVALEEAVDGSEWFRYHQLFRALLEQRLAREAGAAGVEELHRRAADWFTSRELIDEAIDHLLAAGDHDGAARLVEDRLQDLLSREEWLRLDRWLRRLPTELVQRRSGLLVGSGFVAIFRGQPARAAAAVAAAQMLLDQVVPTEVADRRAAQHAEVDTLAAFVAYFQGRLADAASLLSAATERFPSDRHFVRGNALFARAMALRANGQGAIALREVRAALSDPANQRGILAAKVLQSLVAMQSDDGDLVAAQHSARQWLEHASREGLHVSVGWAHITLGNIAYEWNQLTTAADHFEAVLAAGERSHMLARWDARIGLALTRHAQGATADAERLVDELAASVKPAGDTAYGARAAVCRAHVALARGEQPSDAAYLEARSTCVPALMNSLDGPGLLSVRLLLARGEPEDLTAAERHLAAARAKYQHEPRWLAPILAHEALLSQWRRDEAAALDRLARAVELGEPAGLVRTFVDLGAPLAALLWELAARWPSTPYLTRLLAACGAGPAPEGEPSMVEAVIPRHVRADVFADVHVATRTALASTRLFPAVAHRDPALVLVETLTEREVQVLEQLVRHLTNKEIAAELSISPLTVKRHVSNLCGKLGASTRRQAVAMAAALGLAPQRAAW